MTKFDDQKNKKNKNDPVHSDNRPKFEKTDELGIVSSLLKVIQD